MKTLTWKKTSITEYTAENGYQIKIRKECTPLGKVTDYDLYKDGEEIKHGCTLKQAKEEAEWRNSGLSYVEWLASK